MDQTVNTPGEVPGELKKNANKLIILGVLLLVLVVVLFMIRGRGTQTGKPIAGSSFTLMQSFYDLKTPLGVATDRDENIYIANTGNSEIIIYDRDGNVTKRITSVRDENGQEISFPSPYGIAVDDDAGKIYICDYIVRVLNKEGEFLYDLIPPAGAVSETPGEGPARPNEVAVYKDRVYVTSRDGVYVFDSEGKFIQRWGTRGKAAGQYDFPNGIAVDQNSGNIYVVDTNNWRVVALTPEGKTRWIIGNQDNGKVPSPFHLPRSVSIGSDGLVYITDIPDRIVCVDQDGRLISTFGERGTADAEFNFPEGLSVTASNRLYLADRENNRVQVWQLTSDMPAASTADADKFNKALKKY